MCRREAFRNSVSGGVLILAIIVMSSCSADWPAFRHNPLRTGAQLNHGPLTDPAKVATLAVSWSFPDSAGVVLNPPPGPFRASPIVANNVVYIGNSNGYFYAINAADGTLKWQYPSDGSPALTSTFISNPSSEGIASAASYAKIGGADAVVFGAPDRSIGAGLGSGRLVALNAGTGAEIWKSPEIAVLLSDGVTHEQIGYSSPLVFNDHVYIGVGDHGDDPIQRGKVVAVHLADGTIDGGFSFFSTGPPRGGGVWGSQAGWIDNAVYVTTGNSNIGGANPVPNHALSLLRLNANTGSLVWAWQPVPYDLDQDPDWSATPSVTLGSCGVMAVSVQKDGWTWAVNAGNGVPGSANVRWAFPTGPWVASGFVMGDGTVHGDTRYLRPGAVWDDIYIVQTGGIPMTSDPYEGFHHLYALNACASDAERVRWIKDVPNSSGAEYSLGPPTVTHGVIFVGTDMGHLVVIGDPSVAPAVGWRCNNPTVPSGTCTASGFTLVPDPAVLKDIDLHAGSITTEPALVGDPVYVSTDGGKVFMLKPTDGRTLMLRILGCVLGLLTTGSLFLAAAFAQQATAPESQQKGEVLVPLSRVERFDGKTTLQVKGGKSRELHVVVQDWGIHGRQRVEKFPEEGFMLVHLLAGKVTAVIDGREQAYTGGEYWTVPAGSTMSVQVTSESASLQTLAVRKK